MPVIGEGNSIRTFSKVNNEYNVVVTSYLICYYCPYIIMFLYRVKCSDSGTPLFNGNGHQT